VRHGAFSAAAQDRDRDELKALRGELQQASIRQQEGKSGTLLLEESDLRDEAGFLLDANNVLQYVSREEAARQDALEYEVAHKRVAIRKHPSADSHVLGASEQGEKLNLFEWDATGTWRKLHFRLPRGGLVEAWVTISHQQLGVLLRRTDGVEVEALLQPEPLPSDSTDVTATAAAAAAATGLRLHLLSALEMKEAGHHSGLSPQRPRELESELDRLRGLAETETEAEAEKEDSTCVQLFEVVRRPFTAVRSQPSMTGHIVTTAEFGHTLDTFGWDSTRAWRKVYCRCSAASDPLAAQEVTASSFSSPLVAWMLVEHPELGPLLRLVEDRLQ